MMAERHAVAMPYPEIVENLISVIVAVILPFRRWSACRMKSLLPLVFLIACFVITRFIDFTALWLAFDPRWWHADREEIVRRVTRVDLRPNDSHNVISLPEEFAPVSLGGCDGLFQPDGDRFRLLLFTFRGVIGNFAGFVYTSDGTAPKNNDFAGEFIVIRKVEDRWYYVSAH